MTAQFPTTTTVHTTTIHTGLSVAEHGLYEWFVYEPELDRLICPLTFSFAGDDDPHTLLAAGFDPQHVYSMPTLYGRLGVPSHGVVPAAIVQSVTSHWLGRGASAHGFERPTAGSPPSLRRWPAKSAPTGSCTSPTSTR